LSDQIRRDAQRKEVQEKGFFMTAEGIKSTLVEVPSKKRRRGQVQEQEDSPESEQEEEQQEEQKTVMRPPFARTAYILFSPAKAQELRVIDKTLSQVEAMKQAAAVWNTMSELAKTPFIKLAKAETDR
jgi:hypothetical protein